MHACSQQRHSQSQKVGTTTQVIFYQLTSGQTNVAHPRHGMWFCPRRTRHWHGLQHGPALGTRAQWEAETKGPGALLRLPGRPRTGKSPGQKAEWQLSGAGRGVGDCLGYTVPPGGWGCLGTRWWWWQHTIVNVPKATLWLTLKQLTVYLPKVASPKSEGRNS